MKPTEDDSIRTFERRAVANVGALAHRLIAHDSLQRRRDRLFSWIMSAAVLTVIAALSIWAWLKPPESDLVDRHRCETAFRVDRLWQLKKEIVASRPGIGKVELSQLLDEADRSAGPAAAAHCARKR